MMDFRKASDDFFTIGNIAILQRNTGNDGYDFNFRNSFECKSVVSEVDFPVLLHIGAVEDYAGMETSLKAMGMKLLIHEAEHLRCSTIEKWYPALKDKTPFTKIYDALPDVEEIRKDFSFPVFIKGNRQTNRHKRSQCIIESVEQYDALRKAWTQDAVLSWQKVAVREYVPLLEVDSQSFPDQVPISYEFRFFYFEGKCMAYGSYWNMGRPYSLPQSELPEVLKLTDWAAERLGVSFPAIDVAKTASGEWIIIEVNDAQESGFVGLNPLILWNNTISAMQERTSISVEDFLEGAVIMGSDPLPDATLEDMRNIARNPATTQALVDAYACVQNKFWWVEDDLCDFEAGTAEYGRVCAIVDAWEALADDLKKRVVERAKAEGLLSEPSPNSGQIKQLEDFMRAHGYRDGRGWWVKI